MQIQVVLNTACVCHTCQHRGLNHLTPWTLRVAPLNCCRLSTAAWWVTTTAATTHLMNHDSKQTVNWDGSIKLILNSDIHPVQIPVQPPLSVTHPACTDSVSHSFSPFSQDMSEGSGCGYLLVKARFAFQQTNEDELSFSKGDIISVSRQEDGGWWEGSLNGKSGWFPSNYVRELKGSGWCSSYCFRCCTLFISLPFFAAVGTVSC